MSRAEFLTRVSAGVGRPEPESVAAGLAAHDLRDTARDTLDWYRSAGEPPLACGLAAQDEVEALSAWRARS